MKEKLKKIIESIYSDQSLGQPKEPMKVFQRFYILKKLKKTNGQMNYTVMRKTDFLD